MLISELLWRIHRWFLLSWESSNSSLLQVFDIKTRYLLRMMSSNCNNFPWNCDEYIVMAQQVSNLFFQTCSLKINEILNRLNNSIPMFDIYRHEPMTLISSARISGCGKSGNVETWNNSCTNIEKIQLSALGKYGCRSAPAGSLGVGHAATWGKCLGATRRWPWRRQAVQNLKLFPHLFSSA